MSRIFLSPPDVSGMERELLLEAFDSNWIAPLGPHVDRFEEEMCQYIGIADAAALSSGTAALHLALIILGVEPGDEVICSTMTFAATANAIRYCGATPVFIDSEPRSWNIDPNLLEDELAECAARGRRIKAAIVVDLYGQTADYDAILSICARYGVPVIEDAAEALGATYKGKKAGRFGVMSALSFNGNKIITTSGGGMLLSDDPSFIRRARFLATQARDPAPHYEHSTIGYNYRLSNLLAAVGRGQLRTIDARVEKRRGIQARYAKAFSGVPGIVMAPEAPWGRSNCWLTCVLIDAESFGMTREAVRVALEQENIEARPVWKPMHLQPVFRDCRSRGGLLSAGLFEAGLCLPSGSNLQEGEQARIIEAVLHAGKAAVST